MDLYRKIEEVLERNVVDATQSSKEKMVEELHIYHEELYFQNEELKRLNQQMSEFNQELKTLFNRAPLSYLFVNKDGVILKYNDHFMEIFGVVGPGSKIFTYIHEEDQDLFYYYFKEIGKETFKNTSSTTIRFKNEYRVIHMKISTSKEKIQGEEVYLIGLVDVSDERLYLEKIQELTFKDSLTNLYNRMYFNEEVKRLNVERNLPIGIISLDINGLKLINDSFGHDQGDLLLKVVADTLRSLCRKDEIISRVGGDEFVILVYNISFKELDKLYARLKNGLSHIESNGIMLSIAIGYGFKEEVHTDIQEVLKEADKMMYRNKLYMNSTQNKNIINGILASLHEKHPREESHSNRVSHLMERMAQKLNLDENQRIHYRTLGLLHDIGKVGIDYAILEKVDALTSSEVNELRRHPEIGYRILKSVKIFNDALEPILSHHERIDGNGYPRGLVDNQITTEAKALMICDAYDAITSDRPYRKARSRNEAVEEMLRHAGTQFDAELLNVFCEVIEGE